MDVSAPVWTRLDVFGFIQMRSNAFGCEWLKDFRFVVEFYMFCIDLWMKREKNFGVPDDLRLQFDDVIMHQQIPMANKDEFASIRIRRTDKLP